LRHAFASLLIREQRTSIVELAEQLGHAPTMTLNTYTHVFREHRRAEPVDVVKWIREARRSVNETVAGAERDEASAQKERTGSAVTLGVPATHRRHAPWANATMRSGEAATGVAITRKQQRAVPERGQSLRMESRSSDSDARPPRRRV
jgi:hypothetical protein